MFLRNRVYLYRHSVCRARRRVFCIISQCHSSHVNNGVRPRRPEIIVGCAMPRRLKCDIALTRTRWIRKWILDVTVLAPSSLGSVSDAIARGLAPRYRYSPRALSAFTIMLEIYAEHNEITRERFQAHLELDVVSKSLSSTLSVLFPFTYVPTFSIYR